MTAQLDGLTALVVEDGWQVAEGLRLSLERMGLTVAGPVATAAEAERLAAASLPDIALVDVNLKGQMAYALMQALHARGVRVIVVSGYEDLPAEIAAFAAVLRKPFTTALLQETLQQVAGRPARR